MDFEMPYAQKHAWDNLKDAVNDYAELTGSEVAVVTSYHRSALHPGSGDGPGSSDNVLAMHGHGTLLLQLRQCLEQIKNGIETSREPADRKRTSFAPIPVPTKAEENYHNQSMARSLTSTFQSLKLDHRGLQPGAMQFGGARNIPQSAKRSSRGHRRKNDSMNGDVLELNENLLFEEQPDVTGKSQNSDSDDDDSGDDFAYDLPGYQQQQPRNFMQRTSPEQPSDATRYGTSLPVNINMNFARRYDGPSRLQIPGPQPVRAQLPSNQVVHAAANRPKQAQRGFEDTPNPETMMASMQALARSVTDDSALIFGERPRPRLNTGESRGFHDRRK